MENGFPTKQKLIESLNVIQETCKEYDACRDCPLGNENDECLIGESSPEEWKVGCRTYTRVLQ